MRIRRLRVQSFKRFHDLTIEMPFEPRLVVMCGPNGVGKSSVIDAARYWHGGTGIGEGWQIQEDYHLRAGDTPRQIDQYVHVDFHSLITDMDDLKKLMYFRTAYRHEPDFRTDSIQRSGSLLDAPKARRMIDAELKVSDNYQRLISSSIDTLYSGHSDDRTVGSVREEQIGRVRDSMLVLFPDLRLEGPGDPVNGGTFYFTRSGGSSFHYKNLSGGEKAAFDLILDLALKAQAYDDTVYFIDEPELHLNARVQAKLLDVMLDLIPVESQLWLATHSIGMIRRANELHRDITSNVAFVDFDNQDFDSPVVLTPIQPTRDLWNGVLKIALDDLAALVAPSRVVLCEGRPTSFNESARAEFDARCYRAIFADEFPHTDFVSVGNAHDVASDRMEVGRAIQAIVAGTQVIRLIDRDLRTAEEVADLGAAGVRVLGRRHIESFLLDDAVLRAFASHLDQSEAADALIQHRDDALAASQARGNDPDDLKSAAGEFYVAARTLLGLTGTGSTTLAFLADTLAPLIRPSMSTYTELRSDIFGE